MELLTEEQLVFAVRDQKWTSAATKRLMDIVVSAIALTVLGMPMLCIAIAIKLTSKGPVLHWSKRTGREGRIFLDAKVQDHACWHARGGYTPVG